MAFKKYTMEQKGSIVSQIDELRQEGQTTALAAYNSGIHHLTYYKWRKIINGDGEINEDESEVIKRDNERLKNVMLELIEENQALKVRVKQLEAEGRRND